MVGVSLSVYIRGFQSRYFGGKNVEQTTRRRKRRMRERHSHLAVPYANYYYFTLTFQSQTHVNRYNYNVRMLLPELYAALPRSNVFNFHEPTSGLTRALFVYLWELSGNTLKPLIFNRHSLTPLATYYSASDSISRFWRFINSFTY